MKERAITRQEALAYYSGREGKHVRDHILGRKCGHRKYGVLYDSYETLHSYWTVSLPWGGLAYLSFFGLLQECDLCKAWLVRWR